MGAKDKSVGIADLQNLIQGVEGLPKEMTEYKVIKAAFFAARGQYDGMYNDASDPNNTKLQWQEFRIFLIFVKQYFRFFVLFDSVDTTGDGKIEFKEFQEAAKIFEEWGQKIDDLEATFKEIDSDHELTGSLDFKEFTTWAIKYSIGKDPDGGKDDDVADEILQKQVQ